MPLEINAQFNQFVQFAQDRAKPKTSKAIARAGDEIAGNGNLAGRSIVRAGNDRVAPLWRTQGKKAANDAARNLFRQSIAAMFGGENKIPPSVKAAMRLEDYDKGKPLTARRIMMVKTAVDEVLDRAAPALEQAKAKASSLYAPRIRGNVPAEERRNTVDRLASLDYSRYDDGPSTRYVGDPNVKEPYMTLGPTLGEGFAFKTGNAGVVCKNLFKISVA